MKFDVTKETIDDIEFIIARTLDVLSDEEYDDLKPVIESMGGHWRERVRGFCFSKESLKRTNYSQWQESIQFFPTPIDVARRLVKMSGVLNNLDEAVILEPSAGQGGLLEALPDNWRKNGYIVEPEPTNADVLTQKGYDVIRTTFEEFYEAHKNNKKDISHVLMNPPFSLGRDISHVQMAYNLLMPGGTLMAIISENTLYYERQSNRDFCDWLKTHNAQIEAVPYGSFIDCGTAIDTVMIKIVK